MLPPLNELDEPGAEEVEPEPEPAPGSIGAAEPWFRAGKPPLCGP